MSQSADKPQSSPRGRFIGAARVFTLLTLVSRILGVVRDKVCALQFGNGSVWSAWTIAFAAPNLFRRLFGEGALTAALVPVLTDYDASDDPRQRELGRQLIHAVVTLLAMLLAGLTIAVEIVLLILLKSSAAEHNLLVLGLTAVTLPYVILVCLVAVLSAVLNVRNRFAEGAAAPIILNVAIIAAAALAAPTLADSLEKQIFVLAGSVLVAGVFQLAMVWRALHVRGITLRPRIDLKHPGVRRIALLMAPMVAGLAVVQLNSLADKLIAWFLTERPGHGYYNLFGWHITRFLDEGATGTLERAARLYELPLGVFSVALATAIFPALSRHATDSDHAGLADTLRRGLEVSLLIAIPATVGLLLIRTELVQLVYEGGRFSAQDTSRVAWVMSFYVLGLAAFSVQQMLVRAFYALKRVRTPVKIAAWMVALNLPLNFLLIWAMRKTVDPTAGLALSTTLCAVLQVLLLGAMLRRDIGRLGGRRIMRSAAGTAVAAGLMGVAVWIARKAAINWWGAELGHWGARLGRVFFPVAAGMLVFYLAARLIRIEALGELTSRER